MGRGNMGRGTRGRGRGPGVGGRTQGGAKGALAPPPQLTPAGTEVVKIELSTKQTLLLVLIVGPKH